MATTATVRPPAAVTAPPPSPTNTADNCTNDGNTNESTTSSESTATNSTTASTSVNNNDNDNDSHNEMEREQQQLQQQQPPPPPPNEGIMTSTVNATPHNDNPSSGQCTPPTTTDNVGLSLSHSPSPISSDENIASHPRYVDDGGQNGGKNALTTTMTATTMTALEAPLENTREPDTATPVNSGNTLPLLPRSLVANGGSTHNQQGNVPMMWPSILNEETIIGSMQTPNRNDAPLMNGGSNTVEEETINNLQRQQQQQQQQQQPEDKMEARILQLEQSLHVLTQFCQSMMQQQQQQQQQLQLEKQRQNQDSHEGTPTTPSTPSVNHRYTDTDTRILAQWPPSQHPLLDSPEVSTRRNKLHHHHYRHDNSNGSTDNINPHHHSKPSKTMSMVLLDIAPGESRGPSMIPFTEDLDADDEMDGDSVAGGVGCDRRSNRRHHCRSGESSSSNSGASSRSGSPGRNASGSCSESGESNDAANIREKDDNTNKTIVKRSAKDESTTNRHHRHHTATDLTTPTESSDEGTPSNCSSRGSRERSGGRLASSLKIISHHHNNTNKQENNLECQNYTPHHLEALKLRHEAGKTRAYSFNDAPLASTAKTPDSIQKWKTLRNINGDSSNNNINGSSSKLNKRENTLPTIESPQPFRPIFNVLDVEKEHKTTFSTDTFVEVSPSCVHNNTPLDGAGRSEKALVVESSSNKKNNSTGLLMPDLNAKNNDKNDAAAIARKDAHLAADPAVTTKELGTHSNATTSDTNAIIAPSTSRTSINSSDTSKTLKSGSSTLNNHSAKTRSGSVSSRDRSASICSSTKAEKEAAAATNNNASALVPKSNASGTEQSSGQPQEKQTMLDYVKNDLLNIDSKHQDGSATEDVDANMEEFLRIPMKLEKLMFFSLAVCVDTFLYVWTMLPLKVVWGMVCLLCTILRPGKGIGGIMFHRRHLYALLQSLLVWFVYDQVLCPISIGKLYHWIRGQAMLKLYVLIAIVEVFDRLLCSFGQDAWDSLYWNTTRRPKHPRMLVSMIVVGVYVTIHSLFLFVHVATLSVAVNSADNALLTLLISGNFAEIKSTVFKKYNKQNLFKITTSDICERFKLALFLLLILLLNCYQGEMSKSMVFDYYSMCGIVLVAELISDWIKHSFITKFNFIKSSAYFDYALILSGDVTGIGHEGLNLDYTHAAVKRLGLAQIPLVCVTARYLHEAVRFAIAFRGNGDVDHPVEALTELMADGNKWKFYGALLGSLVILVGFKILLGMCIRYFARKNLGGNFIMATSSRKSGSAKSKTDKDAVKKNQ